MSTTTKTETRYENARETLATRGQTHVLRWWQELDDDRRTQLLDDIESIPWSLLDPVIPTHVLAAPKTTTLSNLAPAEVLPSDPGEKLAKQYADARELGERLLKGGKVAAFTVAGGQGTRLGHDGPKGTLVVTPVGGRTLFHLFAETVQAASTRYRCEIPWYIMTSEANHHDTHTYFCEHDWFGLSPDSVKLFSQGMLPAFDFNGKLLLTEKHRLARAPDGHGGSLKAMIESGATADMRSRGIEIISYFQVDNPLVKPFDPLFIGLHAQSRSEMSTKVARKASDLEKVGNLCVVDGKTCVVEYSDFPEALAHEKNDDGSRRFDAGNLAIHLLNLDFVERIVGSDFRLPFRRAEKKVSHLDEAGQPVETESPNAVKLETFVFDALPLAEETLALDVDRAEEFSPVKNATGADSLESSHRDQIRRTARWLQAAGIDVPNSPDGEPATIVAISPTFAMDIAEIKGKRDQIPDLKPGDRVWIE